MIIVEKYNEKKLDFYCGVCKISGSMDTADKITDNCAVDFELRCSNCGDKRYLIVVKCIDPARSQEMQAKYEFLKLKRFTEADYGYKDGEQ